MNDSPLKTESHPSYDDLRYFSDSFVSSSSLQDSAYSGSPSASNRWDTLNIPKMADDWRWTIGPADMDLDISHTVYKHQRTISSVSSLPPWEIYEEESILPTVLFPASEFDEEGSLLLEGPDDEEAEDSEKFIDAPITNTEISDPIFELTQSPTPSAYSPESPEKKYDYDPRPMKRRDYKGNGEEFLMPTKDFNPKHFKCEFCPSGFSRNHDLKRHRFSFARLIYRRYPLALTLI